MLARLAADHRELYSAGERSAVATADLDPAVDSAFRVIRCGPFVQLSVEVRLQSLNPSSTKSLRRVTVRLVSSWNRPRPARRMRWSCTVTVALGVLGCRDEPPPPPPPGMPNLPTIVVSEQGLDAPTAVIHDPRADVYLVTNAPAAHGKTNQPGFVARLAPSGKVLNPRWIVGGGRQVELRQPTAMAIRGDTLYVADQTCVRLFHRKSGLSLGSICPDGATELASLAVRNSVVYVIDRSATPGNGFSVIAIDSRGHVSPVEGSEALSHPSGIAAGPWGLFVTRTGEDYVSQLTRAGARPLLRGSAKRSGGIVAAREGSFAFSNSTDSAVHYVDVRFAKGRGALYTLARQLAEPGQLGYDASRDRILIPEAGRNRITFVDMMNSEGPYVQAYDTR